MAWLTPQGGGSAFYFDMEKMCIVIKGEHFTGSETFKRSFEDALVIGCVFADYELEGANLMGAAFVDCTFEKVNFYWASMFKARFIKCRLEAVDFRGANMAETVFAECRIERCDFSKDNLGADTDITQVTFFESEHIDHTNDKPTKA